MLDLFAFLMSLIQSLLMALDKIDISKQKRLARRIVQTHLLLKTIIESAERIFGLIEDAEKQIAEYGEDKFTQILQQNFRAQILKIEEIRLQFEDPDMLSVLEMLDIDFKKLLKHSLYSKSRRISFVIDVMSFSKLSFENGILYAKEGRSKTPAFPEFDKQLEVLRKLDEYSKSLSKELINKIQLKELL